MQRGAVAAVPVAPIISWLSRADVLTWATQGMCICRGDIERRSFICRVFAAQWWNAAVNGLELARAKAREEEAKTST